MSDPLGQFSTITDMKVLCGPVDEGINHALHEHVRQGWVPYGSPAVAVGQCGHVQLAVTLVKLRSYVFLPAHGAN